MEETRVPQHWATENYTMHYKFTQVSELATMQQYQSQQFCSSILTLLIILLNIYCTDTAGFFQTCHILLIATLSFLEKHLN
uniref:RNA-binding protein 5 isoform X2 n=1 Tax=Rhizophora mucronata TaxID=61149 RepID=A0A2P2KN52_RHIMU